MPLLIPPPPALRTLRFCTKSDQNRPGLSTGIRRDSPGLGAGTTPPRNTYMVRNARKGPAMRTGATMRNAQRHAMRAPHAAPRNARAIMTAQYAPARVGNSAHPAPLWTAQSSPGLTPSHYFTRATERFQIFSTIARSAHWTRYAHRKRIACSGGGGTIRLPGNFFCKTGRTRPARSAHNIS